MAAAVIFIRESFASALCAPELGLWLRGLRQLEHPRFADVGERLGVTRPRQHGAQGRRGLFIAHVVLELFAEATERRAVIGAALEDAADVRRQWNVGNQVVREELLALVDAGLGETASGI